MNELETKLLNNFGSWVQEKSPSNESLIEFIKLAGSFLNLKTIPAYAKDNKMSYEGVKRFRQIVTIFGVKYVIDNK
jgi:hypothetical protein